MSEGRPATIGLNGWFGFKAVRCTVFDELKRSYRVRLDEDCTLPGGRIGMKNALHLVPKRAVKFQPPEGREHE